MRSVGDLLCRVLNTFLNLTQIFLLCIFSRVHHYFFEVIVCFVVIRPSILPILSSSFLAENIVIRRLLVSWRTFDSGAT